MEKIVKKSIKMVFKTLIQQGDHKEAYEFTTRGDLFKKGQSEYLRFEEKFGEEQTVQTTMKWNGHELMLIRQGSILMRQAFIAGETTVGRYVTPEISWETTAKTEKVIVAWPNGKKRGKIHLRYHFLMQGQDTGTHEVRLTLEEDKSK
ncbi:hypothetical protein AJ85_19835 [Alkalihalobacillus alcalophilus ATCC 27647 = CGMCC 1.3604]|uniref:DUF1934 domain-containing protein n=1 Tax=Alkalihalobacillus alcalophilus ATCC 27647 = CGMCC 1.3604 TaxID=1218173 RepID=A0A094YRD5_ALKAL|nr:DUF1934 family protein [Alkalihalobacillus alcalophilus]KGA96047.1 hypothetical protein BALCAV_0218705 [Alkalihalobacillus alcalophilus ATCC 27647 = CGMCC 1.3604]MED1561010.1 DUF1934 family protein [Alkalihalobacillus alcalophilus]THG89058.1 hypothetical protein AJ85_19835 [Alkalihalobacillus alcalophilus ATCC 27647 = CGMCC 1.3604]